MFKIKETGFSAFINRYFSAHFLFLSRRKHAVKMQKNNKRVSSLEIIPLTAGPVLRNETSVFVVF